MAAKTFFNWSTGKDSALALYRLRQDPRYSVERLLTSVNKTHDRVSMHGLRRELMAKQIAALELPVTTVELEDEPGMAAYETAMRQAVEGFTAAGYTCAAFGDIFLEDLRCYREQKLAALGVSAVFPLWKRDTRALLTEFIELGFKAVVVCVNLAQLDASFAGRELDLTFLADLPATVDPCGENGEYHTFCYAGPVFRHEIAFTAGEKVFRSYGSPTLTTGKSPQGTEDYQFCFADLIPV